jgi:hypothetical protein
MGASSEKGLAFSYFWGRLVVAGRNLAMKELLLVLVGGICSALGGFLAVWYRAKKASKIKF